MIVVVWIVPRWAGLALLLVGTTAALTIEWARFHLRFVRYHFLRITRRLLRAPERTGLSGATYMSIGYLTVLVLFPKTIAVLAMLYSALGDATAAVVGTRWGRHRMSWGKSWEGMLAGLVVNLAAGAALPGVGPASIVLGGLTASILEFLPLPLDDNLKTTIGGGTGAWVGLLLDSALG